MNSTTTPSVTKSTIQIDDKKKTIVNGEFKVKDFLEYVDECSSLVAEKIVGATEINGKLMFLLKFENSLEIFLIQSKIANVKYPQVVIQFYEKHYTFVD